MLLALYAAGPACCWPYLLLRGYKKIYHKYSLTDGEMTSEQKTRYFRVQYVARQTVQMYGVVGASKSDNTLSSYQN